MELLPRASRYRTGPTSATGNSFGPSAHSTRHDTEAAAEEIRITSQPSSRRLLDEKVILLFTFRDRFLHPPRIQSATRPHFASRRISVLRTDFGSVSGSTTVRILRRQDFRTRRLVSAHAMSILNCRPYAGKTSGEVLPESLDVTVSLCCDRCTLFGNGLFQFRHLRLTRLKTWCHYRNRGRSGFSTGCLLSGGHSISNNFGGRSLFARD